MKESTRFVFNGISSEDMGVKLISLDGLMRESFLPTNKIVENYINGNDKPYFDRIEKEPIEFDLTLYIEDWKSRDNIRQIARWLDVDYYKPLKFESDFHKTYQAITIGESTLNHNGLKEGYLTITMRTDSPFAYSDLKSYNLKSNPIIFNHGDMDIKPSFIINNGLTGTNSFEVKNLTTNQVFKLNNIHPQESVMINFEKEDVISSFEDVGVYRYKDFIGDDMTLKLDSLSHLGNEFLVESINDDFEIGIDFIEKYF